MAATVTEPTNTSAAEEHPPPSLVDSIRSIVPKYAHVVAPWQASDRNRPGKDSIVATWTTPEGSWVVRYPGQPDVGVTFANALAGRTARKPPVISVIGPAGNWSFPPEGSISLLADYLALVGAVERVAPPLKGFMYVGEVNSDGLSFLAGEPVSFTTTGKVDRATAETLYGGPLPEPEAPARDKGREELELTKREFGLLADDARRRVVEEERRHVAAGVDLADAQRHVRTRDRAVGLLERFYDASVVANIVNGADGQRLVPYADAANIAADLIDKAFR